MRNVRPGTPASEAGLRRGDVIQRSGNAVVSGVDQFRDLVKDANLEQGVLLQVRHGNVSNLVVLKQVN